MGHKTKMLIIERTKLLLLHMGISMKLAKKVHTQSLQMLNLNILKQMKKGAGVERRSLRACVAHVRLQRDFANLMLPETCETNFADANDLFNFEVIMHPVEGHYESGSFVFSFHVSENYPYESPEVKCETSIFHPNIDADGSVCLNILRQDWQPVLSIGTIIYGLLHLLLEPSVDNALNAKAAEMLKTNPFHFQTCVNETIRSNPPSGI